MGGFVQMSIDTQLATYTLGQLRFSTTLVSGRAVRAGGGTRHLGNIQSIFREHSGHIQGTFRAHSGNIQGTFREHSGHIQGTFREMADLHLGWGTPKTQKP
jgi:hypothetical protein